MSNDTKSSIILGILAVVWFAFGIYWLSTMPAGRTTVTYDCRLSEISPDFPIEVKEACRKMRAQSGRI